jgi:hypothetical protein
MAFADDYEVPTRPMTSGEVFAALVRFTRDELDQSSLEWQDRESSTRTLLSEFGNGRWVDAGERLNELFRIKIPRETWRAALVPKRTKTLGEVCDLIAREATVPVIEPVTVLGDRSLAAGGFLVLRRMFAEAGADVSNLRPSSPLRPYLCEKLDDVLPQLIRVAPHQLPPAAVDAPVQEALGCGVWVSFGMICAGKWLNLPSAVIIAAVGFAVLFWVAAWVCGRTIEPHDVRLGDARTFRDLARIIAGERCALPGFPVITR